MLIRILTPMFTNRRLSECPAPGPGEFTHVLVSRQEPTAYTMATTTSRRTLWRTPALFAVYGTGGAPPIADAKRGLFQAVLLRDLSRNDSLKAAEKVIDPLLDGGVTIYTCTHGDLKLDSVNCRIVLVCGESVCLSRPSGRWSIRWRSEQRRRDWRDGRRGIE